jgi:transcriptional regulator with XRE-family HTH domain
VQSDLNMGAIRAALEFHMERTGLSGRQLSRAAGLNETAVRDLLNKVDDPRIGTLMRLAGVLRISPSALFGDSVEIAGSINEHGEILLKSSNGHPLETVARPPELIGDAQAFCVEGFGLSPVYEHGDVVYVSREHDPAPGHFIGRECVVQIASTGAMLLRTVESGDGPGRFNLRLHKLDNILDNVQLAWAAPVLFVARKPHNGNGE